MARITDEYIQTSFLRLFAEMPQPERKGIIRSLSVMDELVTVSAEPAKEDIQLPLFAEV